MNGNKEDKLLMARTIKKALIRAAYECGLSDDLVCSIVEDDDETIIERYYSSEKFQKLVIECIRRSKLRFEGFIDD